MKKLQWDLIILWIIFLKKCSPLPYGDTYKLLLTPAALVSLIFLYFILPKMATKYRKKNWENKLSKLDNFLDPRALVDCADFNQWIWKTPQIIASEIGK